MLYIVLLDRVSSPRPDMGPLVSGYVCLLLLGVLYLAIGVLASSLTSNSTLAFLMTLFTILALLFVNNAAQFVPDFLKPVVFSLSLVNRVGDFAKGIIDTAHLFFFLSTSAWFLFLAVSAVELRRTR